MKLYRGAGQVVPVGRRAGGDRYAHGCPATKETTLRAPESSEVPGFFRRRDGESALDHARRLLDQGPAADAPARWGPLTETARRVMQRVGRHEGHYQRALARAVLDAIEAEGAGRDDRLHDLEISVAAHMARSAALQPGGPARRVEALLAQPRPALGRPGAVDLATDMGPMFFPASDDVVTPFVRQFGYWEMEEADELRALLKPGMTFVDIGAHVGYLTLVAAAAVGPTGRGIAVEPAPGNFALLAANLLRRNASMVEAVNAAAWNQSGRIELRLSNTNSGDHRVSAGTPPAGTGPADYWGATVEVDAVAIDDLMPPGSTVDVVKVDTQGADHHAIAGMAATLGRSRPVLLVEFWPPGIEEAGEVPLEVLSGYERMGFRARVLGERRDRPATPADVLAAAAATPGRYCTIVLDRP